MKNINKLYFFYPLVLLIILVMSVSLSNNLFIDQKFTFAIWFILLLATFTLGWLMHSGFKWKNGIKIILITTVIAVIIGLTIVMLFSGSFEKSSSFLGNIVSYALRIVTLGLSGIFGLSIAENVKNEKFASQSIGEQSQPENDIVDKTEYYIKEAKLKAEKIVFDAEKDIQQIQERKKQIEIQLRELIHTEREVIRSYENEDSNNSSVDDSDKNK